MYLLGPTSSVVACPDHCLTCLNGQVCVSCDSITYMWKGTCTQACEQGLVADLQDRVCYGEFAVKETAEGGKGGGGRE